MTVSAEVEDLRAAVARAVMNWTTVEIPWAYEGVAAVWQDADEVPVMACAAWRPDADGGQCARVLDAMVSRGFGFAIEGDAGGTRAAFSRDGETKAVVVDSERSRAILRAAVAAVRADRDALPPGLRPPAPSRPAPGRPRRARRRR